MQTPISIHQLADEPEASCRDVMEAREIAKIVWDSFSRLERREQDALAARAGISGESCRDVAKRYGVCPQTVCNWASNAAYNLRPRLEDCL
jgi:DNA-directed RNA polymerase sigma subunit (sigma70/sigma32)